jgi:6-phosphogluconate dehydrogenase
MGANMARRLAKDGHAVLGFDQNREIARELTHDGIEIAKSLSDLKTKLPSPRIVWVMLPSGAPTEETILELGGLLDAGDIIVDGGNSYFKDDVRRAATLEKKKIRYLDVGTSGGVWGLERGYSLMIGGDSSASEILSPIFKTLSPGSEGVPITPDRLSLHTADQGYLYCGPHGAGHFVKMIHNGIEYGMMQALSEGFDILRGARSESLPKEHRYHLDLTEIAEVWRRGSVVSSWLLDLIAISLGKNPSLSNFKGHVADSGEGRCSQRSKKAFLLPFSLILFLCALDPARAQALPKNCSPPCEMLLGDIARHS